MLGDTDEHEGWVEDPEWLAREQYLSTLPPEAFEPDDDVPWDIFDNDDIPRIVIDDARITVGIMPPNTDPAQQIDRIHSLQRLLNACAGALAAEELAFADTQVAQQRADQVPTRNLGRGVAEQIGYARRLAPGSASRQLGLARTLTDRLPQAFALLRDGLISEAQCSVLAVKSSHLGQTDAAILDAAMAPRLTGWNLKQTEQAVQHAVYAIDPQGFVDRRGKAEQDRTVWIKPAPDCMATVTALLPVAQGVAVYAALKNAADTRRVDDERSVKQVMADTLVERITGIATNLDSRRRTFDGNARTFLNLRDRTCRQPFCSAPIRHADHIHPHRRGGHTSIDNGQVGAPPARGGLCERGNYVKDMPGWTTSKGSAPGEVITTTPTGHQYRTLPPPQLGVPSTTLRC